MALRLNPIMKNFAAELVGLDVANLTAHISALRGAFAKYSVLIARRQGDATKDDLHRLASVFGRPGGCDDITNLDGDGRILPPTSDVAIYAAGNERWHVDMPVLAQPPLGAMLLARELPAVGGQTQFADLDGAFHKLPWGRRRYLLTLTAVHEFNARMGPTDPALNSYQPMHHPLVWKDPISKRPALFFSSHTSGLRGVQDGGGILDELLEHATQLGNIYTHHWELHDVLLWSNRRAMHRVLPYNSGSERRRLWRVEILS